MGVGTGIVLEKTGLTLGQRRRRCSNVGPEIFYQHHKSAGEPEPDIVPARLYLQSLLLPG